MSMAEKIRELLKDNNLDAIAITHSNRYIEQDILPEENQLHELCGFSGSDGMTIVTATRIYLLVDGRYELQAEKQTDSSAVTVVPVGHFFRIPASGESTSADSANVTARLKNACELLKMEGLSKIGYNSWRHSIAEIEFIRKEYPDMKFVDLSDSLEESLMNPVTVYKRDIEFSGLNCKDKLSAIQYMTDDQAADFCLITSADSISWLFNIYARDLKYSPVVRAYALVEKNGEAMLYGDNLDTDLPHGNMKDFIHKMQNVGNVKVLYDSHTAPEKIKKIVGPETKLIKVPDICQTLKVQKNEAELQGMINCHIRDGVALSKFLCWLDENYEGKTELDIVEKLHGFRIEQKYFFSESFATIAGFADNGAVVHYQPNIETNKRLKEGGLLLLDSGAQYLDGTTDVTRTVAVGNPSKEMIKDFTLVLKAHIALASARFPEGTSGIKLDALARSEIWREGMDYKHGTGHGVACFGNVHEGPISISAYGSDYGFKTDMVTSDEPGIYKENKYGIRTENLLYTTGSKFAGFLEFKTLTKVPIDKRLIDKYMLDTGEQAWLNNYHRDVFDCLAPYMNEKERKWLKDACSPL